MTSTTLNAMSVIVAMATAAMAAEKPNFSGTWKINLKKSDFGPVPPDPALVRTVSHKGSALSIEDRGGSSAYTWKYVTDGMLLKSQTNGLDVQSVAGWEGNRIAFAAKAGGEFEFAFYGRMSLSSDG